MKKLHFFLFLLFVLLYGCSTPQKATTVETGRQDTSQIQQTASVDFETMLKPPKGWHHFDENKTQFRGISSRLAYKTFLENKQARKEVVVAVIDGGIDTDHEDLNPVIWKNEDEIPNNRKDDDQNGYVDDIHGWNFIGGPDGKNVHHDTFELTRIYRRLHKRFSDADTTSLTGNKQDQYTYYRKIKSAYEKEVKKLNRQYNNLRSLEKSMQEAKKILKAHFEGRSYTYEDIQQLQPASQKLNFAQNVMSYVMENDIDSTTIAEQKKQVYEFAKYGYNPGYHSRHMVGDNYEDKTERYYGNNDVTGPDPGHGTHVSGIIAAVRDNGIGIKGVATHTRIMAIRAVPDGDERDKDIANAIRYAVDNGADIINMSFGKGYSPYREVVSRAIHHADTNGVLMIHGAGNEAQNTDKKPNYPTDHYGTALRDSTAGLWISVGATSWKPNEEFIANFSNYGDKTVDLFAPGVDIYSTLPDNTYERQGGTSMASPIVAGAAALIMAYYPELSPRQLRKIMLEHTTKYPNQEVQLPNQGNSAESKRKLFPELSASDGLLNLYKALEAAQHMSPR